VGNRLLRLAAELVALSLPLTWLWLAWGQSAYESFFAATARPLLEAFGVGPVVASPARHRFVSYVPFLVLMLVTPRLGWRRRAGGILLGIPLIFLCHVGLVAVESLSHTRARPTPDSFSLVFPAAMFADAFPFLLWALLAGGVWRGLFARAEPRTPGSPSGS